MAAVRTKRQQPVGSAGWVLDERQQAKDMIDQEIEGFTFSARNELEWLNEHMADIFSRAEFNVPDVYQTPGKLRGKTPRTARKRAPVESRAPLTDIFAPNAQARATPSSPQNGFSKKLGAIRVAEEKENRDIDDRSMQKKHIMLDRANADSGCHKMIEDETDLNPPSQRISQPAVEATRSSELQLPNVAAEATVPLKRDANASEASTAAPKRATEVNNTSVALADPSDPPRPILPPGLVARKLSQFSVSAQSTDGLNNSLDEVEEVSTQQTRQRRGSSSSDKSSPERPVVRKKSSLTFASLPAREPLATNKSFGARISNNPAMDRSRSIHTIRDSAINKASAGRSLEKANGPADVDDDDDPLSHSQSNVALVSQVESEASRLHNKTSTQRLHERITMLGKLNPPQPHKSFATNTPSNEPIHRNTVMDLDDRQRNAQTSTMNDEEWIGPIGNKTPSNGLSHQETKQLDQSDQPDQTTESSAADTHAVSTQVSRQHLMTSKASYPDLTNIAKESTTPAGSPEKRIADGPLSAAKANFNSFLQSAKSMFASSAAASAQAKLETMSPSITRTKSGEEKQAYQSLKTTATQNKPQLPSNSSSDVNAVKPKVAAESLKSASPQKKRRSSQRLQEQAQKLSRQEQSHSEEKEREEQPISVDSNQPTATSEHDEPSRQKLQNASAAKTEANIGQSSNHGAPRRPLKQTKEGLKGKPAAVPIKLASQRVNHFGPSTAALGASLHESLAPPQRPATAPKQPQLTKKGSTSSLRTVSSQSVKANTNGPMQRPAALIAADRKKAQEEKEARRREENKREIERKRAAKAEEEKRLAEERRLAELKKAQELKLVAEKQAAMQQKAEAARKNEQARSQNAPRLVPADVPAQDRERQVHTAPYQKPESNSQRPVPRVISSSLENNKSAVPHVNPAKPPKRYFQPEDDADQSRSTASQKNVQPEAQHPAKRRRTSDEAAIDAPQRPTIGAPIRQSTVRKDPPSRFTHGFMNANPVQAGPSMLKTAVTTSHQMQHPKTPHLPSNTPMTAHMPFGEIPNPPQTQQRPNGRPPQAVNKTPGTAHKSSPNYPNGDNISLPEIATDSEDSDDDDGFMAPDWADSPALRELLRQQQLVDPLKVFGPIAPLQMEEVFKGTNKDRQARFRARTSSANWNGPDKLTDEERKKDFEARARLEKEGAWTFQPGI